MIQVRYSPDCVWLSCVGHAGYGEEGKDIVCAGASALMLAAVDALREKELDDGIWVEPERAAIHAESFVGSAGEDILFTAAVGLKQLAEAYPDYVDYKEVE